MNAKWQKFNPPPPQSRISRIYTRKARNVCTYERQGNRTVQIYIRRLFASKLIGRPIVPTSETYVHVREMKAPMSGGKIWPSKSRSNRCRWVGALLSGICVCVCLCFLGFCPLPSQREDGTTGLSLARAPPCLGGDGETTTDDKRVWAKRMVPRASAYPWAGVSLGVGDSAE